MASSSWPESLRSNRIKAIQQLTEGQQLTNKLREMLRRPENIDSKLTSIDGVVMQILQMFDNTLSILSSCSFNEMPRIPTIGMRSPSTRDGRKSEDSNESVEIATPVKAKKGSNKRRKNSWTSTKLTSTLIDDGYAWRKYGQKVILNAKHQRSYYRCTHKFDQGCQATKLVQKTEDEPPKYKITYYGNHSCKNLLKPSQIILDSPNPKDTSTLLSFETKGLVENKQVDTYFPAIEHELKEGLRPLGNESSSSDRYLSWESFKQLSQVTLEPISMMSSGLDHDDMISSGVYSSTASTHSYDIDHMLGSNDFDDFPF